MSKRSPECRRASFACTVLASLSAEASQTTDWRAYNGGPSNQHYSGLAQINRDNVQDLQIAWTLDTGDAEPNAEMYANPLVIARVIYVISPKGCLIAADAATGKRLWRFDPYGGRRTVGRSRNRGMSYWSERGQGRIFLSARQYLYAIDTKTGTPVASFGSHGRIDLREHLDRPASEQSVSLGSPGVVYKDLLIIGSTVGEMLPAAYGDIRAYDVRSGQLQWTFHTIPRPGEFGYETWPQDTWKHTGGANAWAGLSLDEERGIVYAPTGSTTYDWYSADRQGDNLFANTLLALDAKTGKRLWHFQTVHHDSWDRDLPTAPTLVTVTRQGKRIDAVAQATKTGYLFLFDRIKGTPLFPIEERRVSTEGALEGVRLSPTQPIPVKPVPFMRQSLTMEEVTDRTPEARACVLKKMKDMRSDGPFAPLSVNGTILFPGGDGGAEWGGAAWDPETGLLYINNNEIPWYVRMKKRAPNGAAASGSAIYQRECGACHGADRQGSGEFPSLLGLSERYSTDDIFIFVNLGSGRMPGFARLGREAVYAVAQYVRTGEDSAVARSAGPSPYELKYTVGMVTKLQDPDGYPGIKPPWGRLSAINLKTGDYAWQIPLGEYPELTAKGIPITGSENYGGSVVTAGGLVFIAATMYDRKFRAFDKANGHLLWQTTLPAAGHSTPAVYEIDGRQFVVIAAGGGKAGIPRDDAPGPEPYRGKNSSGSTYIAFALPK